MPTNTKFTDNLLHRLYLSLFSFNQTIFWSYQGPRSRKNLAGKIFKTE